jgi:site-specific recombinase XerD
VGGPLAGYSVRFDAELKEHGYREHARISQLQRLARLSRFLLARELDAYELTSSLVMAFLAQDSAGATRVRPTRPLVEFLVGQDLIEEDVTGTSGDATSELLEGYHQMLAHERGLSTESMKVYDRTAALFLKAVGGAEAVPALDATTVIGFLLEVTGGRSIAWSKTMVFGLRSLRRFFFAEGLIAHRLDLAVPSVASWRNANLPRAVDLHDVKRLVASCDRRTAVGRRDFAILLLLWRLGLRAAEVSALSLDDIDWREGVIVVHGKGNRHDPLPLLADVGDAVTAYLHRGRPAVGSRAVFVTSSAPIRPLSAGGVRAVVRCGCRRAGIAEFGSHRLRHTTATQLLREGSSLVEIAQVLRHDNLDTTSIYAKVDDRALIEIARPWPGRTA